MMPQRPTKFSHTQINLSRAQIMCNVMKTKAVGVAGHRCVRLAIPAALAALAILVISAAETPYHRVD